MDNVREKLVGLIGDCKWYMPLDELADHLIANGVTVQEWIPVTERLPTKEDGDDYGFVYTLETDGKRYVRYWGTVVVHTKICTHWMPLPQPPKGE